MSIKVALVHDWLTGYRGGEKVLEMLCEIFPKAPLYTLVYVKNSTTPLIENRDVRTSFIQNLPYAKTRYRHYLPLFPIAAETLNVKGYDFIFSTSHAVAKSIPTYGAKHWCYVHTPMRYVWDRFDDYFGPSRVGKAASNLFFKPVAVCLKKYDKMTQGRVDHYVANSHFVAERIKKFYGRTAEIIHPPVEVAQFHGERNPQDFYLFFSALVPYKKASHAIEACVKLRRKLVIVGDGPEYESLKKQADSKLVSFVRRPDDIVVRKYLSEAKALLFPGIEDFGIVPVEALASGLPVIGFRGGGLLDSQTEQTCVFYEEQTPFALSNAILKFENRAIPFNVDILRKQADLFSREKCKELIVNSVENFIS